MLVNGNISHFLHKNTYAEIRLINNGEMAIKRNIIGVANICDAPSGLSAAQSMLLHLSSSQ